MKRLAIFAHFDKNNVIDDYVIFYLKALKRICFDIIFVSASELSENELLKLDGIAKFVVEKHKEYDFGSYKRGFFFAKEKGLLENVEDLVFVNDSCYGPFKPLENIFALMDDSKADYWGLSKNRFGFVKRGNKYIECVRPHIQSYFIVFRPSVFSSSVFINFLNSVKVENSKNDVILQYEIGLSEILQAHGFKSEFYLKDYYMNNNPTIYKWRSILTNTNYPFVKCSLLRLKNSFNTTVIGWRDVIGRFCYPLSLVDKNLEYTSRELPLSEKAPAELKLVIFNTISDFPPVIRNFVAKCIKKFFSYIMD